MSAVRTYDPRVAAIHMLRVNVKSLASEARIIKKEEARCGIQYYCMLRDHRVGRLREEARYANLAMAFMRGRAYRQVESSTSKLVDQRRLTKKIQNFLPSVSETSVANWLDGK